VPEGWSACEGAWSGGGEVRIRVPHAYHAGTDLLVCLCVPLWAWCSDCVGRSQKVVVRLEYRASDSDAGGRPVLLCGRARFTRHVMTSLPLVIQAHDHFAERG